MIYNEQCECMERSEIELFQFEKLQSTINRLVLQVPFYKGLFEKYKLSSTDFASLDDLQQRAPKKSLKPDGSP